MSDIQFPRFFSTDSAKAVKAGKYGYLNAINYMAPSTSGGMGDLCPHASPACRAACLGWESGQAGIVQHATGTNAVRLSRIRKARYFMRERQAYLREMLVHIARHCRSAKRQGVKLAVRLNGATDVAYEGLRIAIDAALASELSAISGEVVSAGTHTVFSAFANVQFVDYTKNPRRFDRALPSNLHLTFSRSETNETTAIELLSRGINVAVVFGDGLPDTWDGYRVIDGDQHDLRFLDPQGGFVVGLSPKGLKAKRDTSGFVVLRAAHHGT